MHSHQHTQSAQPVTSQTPVRGIFECQTTIVTGKAGTNPARLEEAGETEAPVATRTIRFFIDAGMALFPGFESEDYADPMVCGQ